MKTLHHLFSNKERNEVANWPLVGLNRHPTWYPLLATIKERRTIDQFVHEAVDIIDQEPDGDAWLKEQRPRLLDSSDASGASAALAEIRAYGSFLRARLTVTPIPRETGVEGVSTPDFTINAGDGPVIVEVFAKHQDKQQDELLAAIGALTAPATTVTELTPAGRPNPNKPGDSNIANLASRACSMKAQELQIPADRPTILLADFTHFGPPAVAKHVDGRLTVPLESGQQRVWSGGLWYGFYGWHGAPIFDPTLHHAPTRALAAPAVQMGHDGRFRLSGSKKTRFSAVLAVFDEEAVLLENPWAKHKLPDLARLALCRYPWFNVSRSIGDWYPGHAEQLVTLQRSMIEAFEANASIDPDD